jgi:hypothetical protein
MMALMELAAELVLNIQIRVDLEAMVSL